MKELRELIQSKLEEATDIDVVYENFDDVIEKGITRFSYKLYTNYVGSDYDKNYTYRVNILGFLERVRDDEENTLEILDEATKELINKMKELNIKSSFEDVSVNDNFRKIQIQGEVMFNELNNGLI